MRSHMLSASAQGWVHDRRVDEQVRQPDQAVLFRVGQGAGELDGKTSGARSSWTWRLISSKRRLAFDES